MAIHAPSRDCRYTAMGRGQAGVLFLRPCAVVAAHMLQLAAGNRLLQFPYHDAEQHFFTSAAVTRKPLGSILPAQQGSDQRVRAACRIINAARYAGLTAMLSSRHNRQLTAPTLSVLGAFYPAPTGPADMWMRVPGMCIPPCALTCPRVLASIAKQ